MNTDFIKKNWIYIVIFCLIILLNVASRFEKNEETQSAQEAGKAVQAGEKGPETLFVDFEEAKDRSKKIETALVKNPALYLFYVFANLSIVFVVFLGLIADGYFAANKLHKKNIIQKTCAADTPPWKIGDIFKILILALGFSYMFFIVFGFFAGLLQTLLNIKFDFLRSENFRMIFDTIVLDFAVFMVILWFLRNVYGKNITDMGFARENAAKNILYGVSGYIAVVPIILAVGILVYILINFLKLKPPPQPIVGLFLMEENTALVFVSSVIASVFGPAVEELFFRGIMYNAVKKKLGIFRSILITSVLFSFLHTHAMTYFLVGFVPITILGMVLAYLYEKTGSLIPSITLHVLNNIGSVIMVFLFKYFNQLVT